VPSAGFPLTTHESFKTTASEVSIWLPLKERVRVRYITTAILFSFETDIQVCPRILSLRLHREQCAKKVQWLHVTSTRGG
jgi:hypothetical protein